MAGLRVEDVGLNTLTVAQSVWGQRVQTPKTQNAIRSFAISAGLRKEIKEMVEGERSGLGVSARILSASAFTCNAPPRKVQSQSEANSISVVGRQSCKDSVPEGLLFTTEKGRPLSMDNFRQRVLNPILKELKIDEKLERLGILRCGNYAFRHMNATLMDTLNTPMKTRQKRLGHAQIETTLKHYTHAISADDRVVADQIGALLASTSREERVQ